MYSLVHVDASQKSLMNSVALDQMPRSATPDLDLQCLLKYIGYIRQASDMTVKKQTTDHIKSSLKLAQSTK